MENILKIIYDKSTKSKIIDIDDIDKIVNYLVIGNELNKQVSNMQIQQIRGNYLASYSPYEKTIYIYYNVIDKMLEDIDNNTIIENDFEMYLYKNISLLQIILHEIEHAKQIKIMHNENSLEAFILRLSSMVSDSTKENLYDLSPEERFAEIKSFSDIIKMILYINTKIENLHNIIATEKLQRLLKGYHFENNVVESPLINYYVLGNKESYLKYFEWCNDKNKILYDKLYNIYSESDRLFYGMPISINEFCNLLEILVLNKKKYTKILRLS